MANNKLNFYLTQVSEPKLLEMVEYLAEKEGGRITRAYVVNKAIVEKYERMKDEIEEWKASKK